MRPLRPFLFLTLALSLCAGAASANQIEDDEVVTFPVWPNRDTVPAMKPDWCEKYDPGHGMGSVLYNTQRALNNTNGYAHWLVPVLSYDYEPTITNFAKIACEWPEQTGVQKQVAAWRQMWINFSGMPEADDRAYLKMLVDDERMKKLQEELDAKKKTWLDEKVSYAQHQLREMVAPYLFDGSLMRKDNGHQFDRAYWMDTPGVDVTPITRAAFVWMCLRYPTSDDAEDLEGVAFCGPDARRIDVAAIDAEAKAMGLNELGQMRAHLLGVATRALYARAEGWAKDWAKKEKSLTERAFTQPEAVFTGWEAKEYQPHKELYDLMIAAEDKVLQMDGADQMNNDVDLGCGEKLRAEWIAHASTFKAKKREDIPAKMDDYGAVLLEHLALCDSYEGRYIDAYAWGQLRELAGRLARGPRLAVANAIHDSYAEQREKSNTLPRLGTVGRIKGQLDEVIRSHTDNHVDMARGDDSRVDDWQAEKDLGTVKAAKKNKAGVELTFKSDKKWEAETACKPSNKIYMVHSDGSIQYESDCKITGWHQVTVQQQPVTVTAATGALIKPGMTLAFVTSKIKDTYMGFPFRFIKPASGKKDDVITHYFLVPIGK